MDGVYFVSVFVPFISFAWTRTGVTTPTYNLSLGINVTMPVLESTVYFPTSLFPSPNAGVSVTSSPSEFSNLTEFSLIGTSSWPFLNIGFPVWTSPWIPVEVAASAVGLTAITVGIYFALAVDKEGTPSLSNPTGPVNSTVTPPAVPLNDNSGWNFTSPVSGTIVYVPSFSTVIEVSLIILPDFGSTNLAIYWVLGLTILSAALPAFTLNNGIPFCSLPWSPVVSFECPVISFGSTIGTYTASIDLLFPAECPPLLVFINTSPSVTASQPVLCPFASTARNTTPLAFPTNAGSGVNVTPVSETSYIPWPGTFRLVTSCPVSLTILTPPCAVLVVSAVIEFRSCV